MTSITSAGRAFERWRTAREPVPRRSARTERLVKERMTLFDINIDGMTPRSDQSKALRRGDSRFLGRSQLSQFMDQTNRSRS